MRFVLSSHREILQFCLSVTHTHTHTRFSEDDVFSHQLYLLSVFCGHAFVCADVSRCRLTVLPVFVQLFPQTCTLA